MNVRSFDSHEPLKWEIDQPTYRADIWTQKDAPGGSGQQFIGWKHEAVYELTDVDDISEAIEWANARVREASAIDGIHQAVSTLYVVLPPEITGAGIVQIHGVNPTRGD
jgi:hypothetical protein